MNLDPRAMRWAVTAAAWVATAVACGGGTGPEFEEPGDQVAQVGVEFTLELRATAADSNGIDYDFRADVPDIDNRATLTRSPTGYGLFKWTPLASDVQEWYFDFTASNGGAETTITVRIDVRSAIGSATAPVFRKPLGTGTTLDLGVKECLDLDLVVEDQDNAQVTLAQEEPAIEGATIEQASGLNGTWRWCPSRAQADAEDRYTLTLSADDASNPKTLKNYLVVLRDGDGSGCPGAAPSISHSPSDESTVVDLTIPADISDDNGLKQAPLFYYSTTNPGSPPDLGSMTQVSMLLISGSMQSGQWAADVPNPVVSQPGSSATLYYVIVANDDDDDMGNCDHRTTSQVYSMNVTNPGGSGTTPLCGSCSADVQCAGSPGNLCVRLAGGTNSYCLQGCGSCPSGYTCQSVTSVNGAGAMQCVPNTGTCGGGEVCIDDEYEDNDSRTQASSNPALPVGEYYDFVSCPSSTGFDDDEDWYKLSLSGSSRINLLLLGDDAADLDLGLYDSTGIRLSSSTTLAADEEINKCLAAGTYYVRAYSWDTERSEYLLDYSSQSETCDTTCQDDSREDDDTMPQSGSAVFLPYSRSGGQICTNDKDYYHVSLSSGDRLIVDLTFTQSDSDEDLDIHLHDDVDSDLTPCCDIDNGQGYDSNEHFEWDAAWSGDYYVVIEGYNGSKNSYSIAIARQ